MRKKHPLRQWLSLKVAKSPRGVILMAILLLNVIFICTSAVVISQLIRGVYNASPENNRNIVLGYVDGQGKITLFCGDQRDMYVKLQPKDKLIVFSNH